jgi:hypothetical protein
MLPAEEGTTRPHFKPAAGGSRLGLSYFCEDDDTRVFFLFFDNNDRSKMAGSIDYPSKSFQQDNL